MAAGAWQLFDSAIEGILDGSIDLDNDSFTMTLHASDQAIDTDTGDAFSDLTQELSTASGYTAGGTTLTNVALSRSGGTVTFDADDVTWTASGGDITARYAVISQASSPNRLLCFCVLDSTPADVTATDGNDLKVTIHTSGIFTAAMAA